MYKVVVYAISKNESKFVDRWFESMKEADEIYVLDTGSEDDTVEKLESHGVIVKQEIINPWRFDIARNKSLDMVPIDTDICVCTDLDEVFVPGWRKELEKSWGCSNRLKYTYNWSLDKNNKPIISFLSEKIHDRIHYIWVNPVHEIVSCSLDKEIITTNENIIVNHYPDNNKSRSSYLNLLELSIKEDPNNDRNMHYLGREYMYYHRWNDSIDTLIKHLNLKSSTWDAERCASMRFISRCYINMNRIEEARLWLNKAIQECPRKRDAYVELAMLEFNTNNYLECIINCIKAKQIKTNDKSYINESFSWDSTIDDLLSISYYRLGLKDESIFYVNKALEYDNTNERILKNKEIFMN